MPLEVFVVKFGILKHRFTVGWWQLPNENYLHDRALQQLALLRVNWSLRPVEGYFWSSRSQLSQIYDGFIPEHAVGAEVVLVVGFEKLIVDLAIPLLSFLDSYQYKQTWPVYFYCSGKESGI
jgi:hypothetical protein